jgi:opacity protein-like surface antigen
MDVTANLSLGPGSVRRSGSRTNTDGIVGIRGNAQIAERWYVSYYADVGAGDSDLTWQLAGTLDYRLSDALSLSVGYRHMQWDFNDPVILQDVSFSGPIFGARLKF